MEGQGESSNPEHDFMALIVQAGGWHPACDSYHPYDPARIELVDEMLAQPLELLEATLVHQIQEERRRYGLAKKKKMLVIVVCFENGQGGPIEERWPIRVKDAIQAVQAAAVHLLDE